MSEMLDFPQLNETELRDLAKGAYLLYEVKPNGYQ